MNCNVMILHEGSIFLALTEMLPFMLLFMCILLYIFNESERERRLVKRIIWGYIIVWILSSIFWYTDTHSQGFDIFLNNL